MTFKIPRRLGVGMLDGHHACKFLACVFVEYMYHFCGVVSLIVTLTLQASSLALVVEGSDKLRPVKSNGVRSS